MSRIVAVEIFGAATNHVHSLSGTKAESARRTSSEKISHRTEDYLKIIYELTSQKGYATVTDISDRLGVTPPSITKMIQKLDKSRHLDYEKYRGVRLTEKGIAVANGINERRKLLAEFFEMIGVDEATARKDVEGIEHHLHAETLEKLREFTKLVKTGPTWRAGNRPGIGRKDKQARRISVL